MQRKSWRSIDPWLLLTVLGLSAFGLLVIHSATVAPGQAVSPEFVRQALYVGGGLLLLGVVSVVDYRLLATLWLPLYLLNLGLLGLVLVVGHTSYGAQRWLPLGALGPLQPSELSKLVVIIALAQFFARQPDGARSVRAFASSFALVAGPVVLIYRQPDLGTALVLLASWFGIAFVAGARPWHLATMAVAPLAAAPVVWSLLKGYMRARLLIFLNPEQDPRGAGYNIIQARISIGSGGWWGRGLGNGTQTQLSFLRVQHTDFIFAVIGEELGFFGAVGLLGAYAFVLHRILRVATLARDAFGRYLATGVASMLLFQVFINVGMNVGLVPVTGIPLPLVSYGGSSLLTTLVAAGILQSVLVHAQTRRYDSPPAVRVPSTVRLGSVRLAAWWPRHGIGLRGARSRAPVSAGMPERAAPTRWGGDQDALGSTRKPDRASA